MSKTRYFSTKLHLSYLRPKSFRCVIYMDSLCLIRMHLVTEIFLWYTYFLINFSVNFIICPRLQEIELRKLKFNGHDSII